MGRPAYESTMELGKRLRQLRKARNLTVKEAAAMMHISKEALYDYECGRHDPHLCIFVILADFYGVSLDYLYGRD